MLRVAAPQGLVSFYAEDLSSGAMVAAWWLVFEDLEQHARVASESGIELTLELLPDSRLTTKELAASVRFDGIQSIRTLDDRTLSVQFVDQATKEQFFALASVASGPYRVDFEKPGYARLVRRHHGPIDVIEIQEMSSDDEWRRLHGRKIDVIPMAEERHRRKFEELTSVRLMDVPFPSETSLYINTRNPALSDVRIRRRLSRAIDREALAKVVCDSERCNVPASPAPDPGDVELPAALVVDVHGDRTESVRAAEVLRDQLRSIGIELTIRKRDLSESPEIFVAPETQLVIGPLTTLPRRYDFFVSPTRNKTVTLMGYTNDEYDEAVVAGDYTRAQALLDRDVPVTPLFVPRYFAVIDDRYCGDVKPAINSWLWIADLRPCRDNEQP